MPSPVTPKIARKAAFAVRMRSRRPARRGGCSDRVDHGLGVLAHLVQLDLPAMERIDVEQRQHGAVDPVVDALVRADAQRVPVALPVLHVPLDAHDGVDGLADRRLQVGGVDVRLDVADRPPDVVAMRFMTRSAIGVNRRMRRSLETMTMAICTSRGRS
jgi:hypothetical protein